jgi:hypothetical protein
MRAFLRQRLEFTGNYRQHQERFFYGMADGIILVDAMFGSRYHAALSRLVMVLESKKSLIYKGCAGEMLVARIMVFRTQIGRNPC